MIADSPLTIVRGASAVVGGQDGEEAPYLFLVVSPVKQSTGIREPLYVGGDVKPPRYIVKTPPQYTEEARKAGIEGVVILQATIDKAGAVSNVKVLKGLPHGLEESAVETIKTWRLVPATLNDEPVDVYYNLTINYRLPDKEDE